MITTIMYDFLPELIMIFFPNLFDYWFPYCIHLHTWSNSASSFGKGMNPTILPPARGKIVRQARVINLGMVTHLREGKWNSNHLKTWRGMGSTSLFLPKTCYIISMPTIKTAYRLCRCLYTQTRGTIVIN